MLNARGMRRSSRVTRVTRFTVVLTAVLALGVGSAREAQAQVSPLPLDFPEVVIFATNSARLQNDAHVVAGHVVVNHASPGPTLRAGVELGVGQHALPPPASLWRLTPSLLTRTPLWAAMSFTTTS